MPTRLLLWLASVLLQHPAVWGKNMAASQLGAKHRSSSFSQLLGMWNTRKPRGYRHSISPIVGETRHGCTLQRHIIPPTVGRAEHREPRGFLVIHPSDSGGQMGVCGPRHAQPPRMPPACQVQAKQTDLTASPCWAARYDWQSSSGLKGHKWPIYDQLKFDQLKPEL